MTNQNSNNNNKRKEYEVDYYIYFDGKQANGLSATACVILDRNKSIRPVATLTETEPCATDNQFSVTLKSILTAVKCIHEHGITGKIALLNQNKTVIDWILKGRTNPNYEGLFSRVIEELSNLQFDCNMFIQAIEPKENRAKKLVSSIKAPNNTQSSMTRLTFDTPSRLNIGGDVVVNSSINDDDDDFYSTDNITSLANYKRVSAM